MTSIDEKRAMKALESIGWALKRVAHVLELGVDQLKWEKPCARCGSHLREQPSEYGKEPPCAVCALARGNDGSSAQTQPPQGPDS
jgi:hypothetical protein